MVNGAKMKCIFCSAPLPKQGLNCNYCNKLNPLNAKVLEDIKEKKSQSQHLCPICETPLKELENGSMTLEYCLKCDGIFIEEEAFEKLIEYKAHPTNQFNPYYLRFIQDHPRDNRKKTQFHNCPVCKEIMHVINYKKQSGILLDICEEHGIWLDGGELQQIIEWYAVGGNKKTRNL